MPCKGHSLRTNVRTVQAVNSTDDSDPDFFLGAVYSEIAGVKSEGTSWTVTLDLNNRSVEFNRCRCHSCSRHDLPSGARWTPTILGTPTYRCRPRTTTGPRTIRWVSEVERPRISATGLCSEDTPSAITGAPSD